MRSGILGEKPEHQDASLKVRSLNCGIMSFTNNAGRARHSVRAAAGQFTRSAGRGLPALPVLPWLFVKGIIPLNWLLAGAAFWLVLAAASAHAQNATINWYRVANGGGVSTGNGCTIMGTIGQAEPGLVQAGNVTVAEGFWSADAVVPPKGSLQVTLAPAGAVSAGAQWQVDGGVWQTNGVTVSGLAVGSHTVAFNAVSGWITPPNQIVTITDNNTTTTSGTYILGGFTFTVNGTAITISGYSGPGGVLAIPSTLAGVNGTVTAIGQSAFQGVSGLTSVTIPDGVTSIGDSAFYGCSGLRSMTIPSSVTTIGADAFEGCSDLTAVTIPGSVNSIGD